MHIPSPLAKGEGGQRPDEGSVRCECDETRNEPSHILLTLGSDQKLVQFERGRGDNFRKFQVMTEEEKNQIRQLTRLQRRVLGTLMEKGFTTPDQYPMTLKGATTGCNQKSNRDPVTEYSEAEVADALEQLRELGLVAEVFTDGGRAPRYRHYIRHKFDFSETSLRSCVSCCCEGGNSRVSCELVPVAWCELRVRSS